MTGLQPNDPSERITLTIPRSLKRRIEATVPDRQRSAFAAKALEEALQTKSRKEAMGLMQRLTPESTKGEDSVDVLCQYRSAFGVKK